MCSEIVSGMLMRTKALNKFVNWFNSTACTSGSTADLEGWVIGFAIGVPSLTCITRVYFISQVIPDPLRGGLRGDVDRVTDTFHFDFRCGELFFIFIVERAR